jgi:hypothetical protein
LVFKHLSGASRCDPEHRWIIVVRSRFGCHFDVEIGVASGDVEEFDVGSEEMERLVAPGATQHAVVDFSDQLVGARSRRAYLSDREPGSYLAVAGTERYSIGLDKL